MTSAPDRTLHLFHRLTSRPRLVLTLSCLFILLTASGITQLSKDTSVRAFIPQDDASVVNDERITEIFGLSDPIAVAVTTSDGSSIFTSRALSLVRDITHALNALPNIRRERVTSLATESSIAGTEGEVLVDAYTPRGQISDADAASARQRWRDMPPHIGTLAADDESGAVILAEVINPDLAVETYRATLALVEKYQRDGIEIHVAGPAAVSAFLSEKIDGDARVMQPLVFVIVLGFIFTAFRRAKALLGPFIVLLGAAGGAMGIMGWAGISYFAITNALPVILVAIAVADAIHVLSSYYQLRSQRPNAETRELVVMAMAEMAQPITLTTLTTIAGFIGIGLASIMPPITYFAWFAALGVALAWVFSVVTLPNMLVLLNLGPSKAFRSWEHGQPNLLGRIFHHVSAFSARRHVAVLTLFALTAVLAAVVAQNLRIDRSQVENFSSGEPIRVADELINSRFAGTSFLDVIVETEEPEGLLQAERMAGIVALQQFIESLPHVEITVGITDYLSLLHMAINEEPASTDRTLPKEDDAIAQYLLIYEASGDPTDFEEEIDAQYQTALIRGVLDSVYFSQTRDAVIQLENYIEAEFNDPGMRATLGGDVNITYHWMSRLKQSHFDGVVLSLLMVLGMAVIAFRSLGAGLLSVVPVSFTIIIIYALMAALNIYLEPATSMFAAISVGVGVDFAIHLVDRLRVALRLSGEDIEKAIAIAVPGTARACFFNAAALGIGFSVMLASQLPMLQRFGGLVTTAALTSFVVGLIVIPACYAAALRLKRAGLRWANRPRASNAILLVAAIASAPTERLWADNTRGLEIANQLAQRNEGDLAKRTIRMTLTDRRGGEKQRVALVLKRSSPQARLTRITYLEPKSLRNTTFLSHDSRTDASPDERWLFIPAARKVRRIPASDRGDYFLGTDFTYEDMQSDLKFDLADYHFNHDGTSRMDERVVHQISGAPRSDQIASELGYGAFKASVDEATWLPLRIEFFDLNAQPLKTIEVTDYEQIDGIWTATEIVALNHQSEHSTRFTYLDVDYPETLPDQAFDPSGLQRRLPPDLLSN